MALPYFYISGYDAASPELVLDEDNSRHIVQVLRMKPGEELQLTNGKGVLLTAEIIDDHKKKCRVAIRSAKTASPAANPVSIAISPLKNASRFEWFLEKATEIGVSTLIPLLCERTERSVIRPDRLQNILVSAMLQSQQSWLPVLAEPTSLPKLLRSAPAGRHFIAHCLETPTARTSLAAAIAAAVPPAPPPSEGIPPAASPSAGNPSPAAHPPGDPRSAVPPAATGQKPDRASLILIGPEGDFSPAEVTMALSAGFQPVTLGANRLRTETAGIVAATLLCLR